ncbi:uncharacterized protein LOC118416460 [Branchiostoma floridae]|uniref:Uncharacterized protein LOC118416460 n=1 Tax=Branchiostoma floridae TaxID=7739 RepID=A0A9J7L7F3_BRAFL|nr:uncharacterized protein LOC118416460 [Branchiostoma floridae]
MTGHGYNDWFIVLDLKESYTLNRIGITNVGDHTHDTKVFKLQKSEAGRPYNWEDVVSVDNVQSGDQRQVFGGFQGKARYWKLVITQTYTGWQPYVRELELYASGFAAVEDVPSGENTCHSIKVSSGEWLVYSNNNFEGTSIRLPAGIYPDPGHIRNLHCGCDATWNDQVRSLRPINQDAITLFDKNDFCGSEKSHQTSNPNIEMDNCCSIIVRDRTC